MFISTLIVATVAANLPIEQRDYEADRLQWEYENSIELEENSLNYTFSEEFYNDMVDNSYSGDDYITECEEGYVLDDNNMCIIFDEYMFNQNQPNN